MLREEVSECAEPPRPPRQTTPWVPIVFVVVLVGLGLAHVAGLTKPLTSKALQWSQGGSGNPQAPASRPAGGEVSEDDLTFQRIMQMMPKDPNQGTAPTEPVTTKAPPSRADGSRNLQTPVGRPTGDAQSKSVLRLQRIYQAAQDAKAGTAPAEPGTAKALPPRPDSSRKLPAPADRSPGDTRSTDEVMLQRIYQMAAQDTKPGTSPTEPVTTKAQPPRPDGSRNLQTPASRLVGDWESNDDPLFPRVCHPVLENPDVGTGLYAARLRDGLHTVIYKIVSQDRSGTSLVMGECLIHTGANYQVKYSVAKDGQSMTREYDGPNGRVSSHYRYHGPPTQKLSECPPW